MKVLSGAEQSALKKENEYFKAFTEYMAKRVDKISTKAKWLFGKSAYEYKVSVSEEYALFLQKTKRTVDPEFDKKMVEKLQNKLESDKLSSNNEIYKHSAEGLFEASRKCWDDTVKEIAEFCGMEM